MLAVTVSLGAVAALIILAYGRDGTRNLEQSPELRRHSDLSLVAGGHAGGRRMSSDVSDQGSGKALAPVPGMSIHKHSLSCLRESKRYGHFREDATDADVDLIFGLYAAASEQQVASSPIWMRRTRCSNSARYAAVESSRAAAGHAECDADLRPPKKAHGAIDISQW